MKWIINSIGICFYVISFAQDINSDSLIKYDSDFKFEEGIYLDFTSLLRNSPIPKGRIVTDFDYDDNGFFDHVLNSNKFYFYDNIGNKIEYPTKKTWGYSRNGFLYINIDNGFYRITHIGSICHFVAYHTYENYPNRYNNPYSSPYGYTANPSTSTEMRQYMFDFKDGRVFDYNSETLEVLLMPDHELHDEYIQLSRKKKKQLKFVYIRKYNERNPLYLIKQ